jgi:hypothetical protein
MDHNPLNNWYPVKLYQEADELKCQWKYFKGIEFTDPFFNDTILRAGSLEINYNQYKPISDLSILTEWADNMNAVEPTLFIFHVSRCGSTLLTQSLGLNDQHIVLSEVPFIDDILKQLTIDEWLINTEYKAILKAAINLYGRRFKVEQEKLFIKTDSWHLYYLPLFRLLYPSTPVLLLFRIPEEVLHSQQKKRGMHAVPGLIANNVLKITNNISGIVNFDRHLVTVLESYFKSMIKIAQNDKLSCLVNYNEGIEQIIIQIAELIGADFDQNYRNLINERSRYNAKFPDQPFEQETPEEEPSNALNKALGLYIKLEKIRGCRY